MSNAYGVFDLVKRLNAKYDHLDVLINNAGLLTGEREITADGFEAHLAVNHIMPALLAIELKPLLRKSSDARIIFLTTGGHNFGKINFEDLQKEKKFYAFNAYGDSKLMHLMWNYAITEDWNQEGIKLYASDPGGAKTNMTNAMSSNYLPFPINLFFPLMKLSVQGSPEKAAKPSIYLATSDKVKNQSGLYVNTKLKVIKSAKKSYDKDVQQEIRSITDKWLWQLKHKSTKTHTL